MNGILNIYKEQGYTSHDVVAILRRILKMKRIGHTGTLDPNAEGVLPICIGQATKLSELLMEKKKSYVASFCLGKTTDTQDIWGEVISEHSVNVTPEEVKEVVQSFVGEIMQIPPMYSAIKQNGKKLYELAREGKEVERKLRLAVIHSISDFSVKEDGQYEMTVTCSKGTYIRTLIYDIGQKLGCGACMTGLKRIASGKFHLENARRLAEIERIKEQGDLQSILIPMSEVLEIPSVKIKEEFQKWLYAGNPIPFFKIDRLYYPAGKRIEQAEDIAGAMSGGNGFDRCYVYDDSDNLIGIYLVKDGMLKVEKFLYQASEE